MIYSGEQEGDYENDTDALDHLWNKVDHAPPPFSHLCVSILDHPPLPPTMGK